MKIKKVKDGDIFYQWDDKTLKVQIRFVNDEVEVTIGEVENMTREAWGEFKTKYDEERS